MLSGVNVERVRGGSAPGPLGRIERWAGAPLFCPPPPLLSHYADDGRAAFSQLAMHARGPPLILQARPNRRPRGAPPPATRAAPTLATRHRGCIDTISVASDESSGSGSAVVDLAARLPRIIKPRKRRKKDRRPTAGETDSASSRTSSVSSCSPPAPSSPSDDFAGRNADRLIFDVPTQFDRGASDCRCRYCAPDGLVWEVERRCRSREESPDRGDADDIGPARLCDAMKAVGSTGRTWRRTPPEPNADAASASEAFAALSIDDGSTSTTSNADVLYSLFSPVPRVSLRITSEIVTSPNGHRDLEIKFFSDSPASSPLSTASTAFRSENIPWRPPTAFTAES